MMKLKLIKLINYSLINGTKYIKIRNTLIHEILSKNDLYRRATTFLTKMQWPCLYKYFTKFNTNFKMKII